MQTMAEHEELSRLASEVIDSCVQAQIPLENHNNADCTQYGRRRKRMVGANAVDSEKPLEKSFTGIGTDSDFCTCMEEFVDNLKSGKLRKDAVMRKELIEKIRERSGNVAGELQVTGIHRFHMPILLS